MKEINGLRNFYGFWDSNEKVSGDQLTQIQLWAKSLLFFHEDANVFLYTKKNIIPEGLINIDGLTIIYKKAVTSKSKNILSNLKTAIEE